MEHKKQYGAEAVLEFFPDKVRKIRIPKAYRHKQIDDQLRKSRTKREAKVLEKLSENGVSVPRLLHVSSESFSIDMQLCHGQPLSLYLTKENMQAVLVPLAQECYRMHSLGIIHGDLTTANMMFTQKVVLLDFGLSFFSEKDEDRAVDLHLFKECLQAFHPLLFEEAWKLFSKQYHSLGGASVLKRLEQVELRGRNKQKYLKAKK